METQLLGHDLRKFEQMNLRGLRVFAAVMEEGTLSRAAARLHMSESAASRQLQLLEDKLGRPLFRRERKRLEATPEAEALLPEVARVLLQLDGMSALIGSISADTPPPLRIVCHSRVLYGLVLPTISRLAKMLPQTKIRLDVQPRRDLGRRMMQGLFDLGVSALPAPTEGLEPYVLGSVPLKILLPSQHQLADARALTSCDLRATPYIALDGSTVIRQLVDTSLAGSAEPLTPTFEVSTGASAYRLVRDGLGFTFADTVSMDPTALCGTVLVPWERGTSISYGSFRAPDASHPAIDPFLSLLREVFEDAKSQGSGPSYQVART